MYQDIFFILEGHSEYNLIRNLMVKIFGMPEHDVLNYRLLGGIKGNSIEKTIDHIIANQHYDYFLSIFDFVDCQKNINAIHNLSKVDDVLIMQEKIQSIVIEGVNNNNNDFISRNNYFAYCSLPLLESVIVANYHENRCPEQLNKQQVQELCVSFEYGKSNGYEDIFPQCDFSAIIEKCPHFKTLVEYLRKLEQNLCSK